MLADMTSLNRSRRLRFARLASLAALAAALFPREAEAQEFTGGGAVYTSFTFGDDYFGFGWGIEGMFSAVLSGGGDCSSDGRAGMGLTAQIGAINVDTFRFVGAFHGGGNVGDDTDLPVIDGEVGVALHANGDGTDVGIHTGVVVDVPFSPISAWSNFIRAEWLLNEYSVGGGVVMPGRFGFSQQACIIGRPLRDDAAVLPLGSARGVDAARLDAAPGAWVEDAQAEAASVPAFLVLAGELLDAGAPLDLVDRALEAAADEIRHARACAAIASRLSGRRVVPTAPPPPTRTRLHGTAALVRLGAESWLDGCLNEGAASARAARAARAATSPLIAATQARIATDEARHAALGWDVLAFALARGGRATRDAVAELRHEQAGFTRMGEAGDERFGQLGSGEAVETNARVSRDAQRRLATMLFSREALSAHG